VLSLRQAVPLLLRRVALWWLQAAPSRRALRSARAETRHRLRELQVLLLQRAAKASPHWQRPLPVLFRQEPFALQSAERQRQKEPRARSSPQKELSATHW
jgi:hypothetical protein